MIANHHRLGLAALCLAALPLAACGGDAGGSVTGSTQGPSTTASCAPGATVDLQPGQTASLTAAQAACFQLAPHAGARYALAGFDARAIEGAQAGPEPSLSDEPSYVVGDGSNAAPTAAPNLDRLAASAAPAGDVTLRADAQVDANTPFARATPWAEGERFPIRRLTGEQATARVVRVMGRYAFALVEGDEEGHTARFISDTEKAMDYLVREGEAVLDRTWGAGRPVTSAGSGQLLVVYGAWNPDLGMGSATTSAASDGSGIGTYVWLNLNVRPGVRDGYSLVDVPSFRLKVLAHELTHAWQMRYAYQSQPAGPRAVSFGPAWAMEGTADLVAMDIVRRSLGVPLTANWSWENRFEAPGANVTYALQPADTRGRLSRGYYDAASFLQDVQVRMTRRGVAADEALAQVARGAVEGWYGIDAAGVRRQGLSQRVRAVLGSGWDPADAVLLWTLTQASDDQTDAVELNNPVYERATDAANPNSWKAAIDEVQAGRGFAYQVTRGAGTSFFVRMKDGGEGGTVALTATVAGTRWMVARLK
ncbi:hypothetical protein [Longimicrobium sp.]|uniref:hypothetical protein n=1 Tax=Longimicrobium sp. TaxID=2029185 RepID=UPI002C40F124|nr:hypothetical protein [Longimicrobium sp.]HSU13340.1 hypothetical protein [Longimicrobium sp.]